MSETPLDNTLRHEGMMARLWAGWRIPYIEQSGGPRTLEVPQGMSLFEAIYALDAPDEASHILWRGPTCFAMLNAFPYTSGHLMVLPRRSARDLDDLTDIEYAELFATVRIAVRAINQAYRPHGVNVGINLGEGSGAGFPDHLHVHCLPRWSGDTNFMTTIAEARVLPESLGDTWRKLRAAWPAD